MYVTVKDVKLIRFRYRNMRNDSETITKCYKNSPLLISAYINNSIDEEFDKLVIDIDIFHDYNLITLSGLNVNFSIRRTKVCNKPWYYQSNKIRTLINRPTFYSNLVLTQ